MVRLTLPSESRSMGIRVASGRGSGKSRLLGRGIAFQDFCAGLPVLIIDPHGVTIDNFLDKFCYLSPEEQRSNRNRILYCDMSGTTGYVPGFPIYYEASTFYDSAFRILDLIRRLDPNLEVAPIRGWNPIKTIGTNAGMVLAALNEPITSVQSLLTQPQLWESRLRTLTGEVTVAADYFLNFYYKSKTEQQKSEAFLPQVLPFSHNVVNKAMFCASTATVDWSEVVEKRMAVLLDFRGDRERRFKILWAWSTFLEFVEKRGPIRTDPISVIIDELSFLLALNSSGNDLLSEEMSDLIDRISRNNNLWLTLAHQETNQIPQRVQYSLMTLGTQILGRTVHPDTALDYAKRFFPYNPTWIKRTEPIFNEGALAATREIEFSPFEQNHLKSQVFLNLDRYEFMITMPSSEGGMPLPVEKINTSWLDPGLFYQPDDIKRLREGLSSKSGIKLSSDEKAAVSGPAEGSGPFVAPARSSTNLGTYSGTSISLVFGSDQEEDA